MSEDFEEETGATPVLRLDLLTNRCVQLNGSGLKQPSKNAFCSSRSYEAKIYLKIHSFRASLRRLLRKFQECFKQCWKPPGEVCGAECRPRQRPGRQIP